LAIWIKGKTNPPPPLLSSENQQVRERQTREELFSSAVFLPEGDIEFLHPLAIAVAINLILRDIKSALEDAGNKLSGKEQGPSHRPCRESRSLCRTASHRKELNMETAYLIRELTDDCQRWIEDNLQPRVKGKEQGKTKPPERLGDVQGEKGETIRERI
jgi:hypothetical protein